jgi:transglutaminase-like putative cysteine protease
MLIKIGYELIFNLPAPASMLLMLYTHPSREADLREPQKILTEPALPIEQYIDSFGNRMGRLAAPAGRIRLTYDNLVRDSGLPDAVSPQARQLNAAEAPPEVMQFLLASRYCEVDRMGDIAWQLFSSTPPGWPRVQAVCGWVHNHVEFGYAYARNTRTALEVYQEQKGVCRDFTHLTITLLRALGIPARYATGYLGDIGVPISPEPMDFSAWLEVYLGGQWHTVDARHNMPRIGRILMARGRDAVDVALTTSFGAATLEKFTVWTDEITPVM